MGYIANDVLAKHLGKTRWTDFNDAERQVLTDIVNAVEALIERVYTIELSSATNTEYHPAHPNHVIENDLLALEVINGRVVDRATTQGREILQLRKAPILISSVQVWEDLSGYNGQASGAFDTPSLLTKGVDYFVDSPDGDTISVTGILRRIGGVWPGTPRTVKVQYVGGATAQPAVASALGLAIPLAVKHNFAFWKRTNHESPNGAIIQSESIGSKYSYTIGGPRGDGVEFGGFGTTIPDEVGAILAPWFNWGAVI